MLKRHQDSVQSLFCPHICSMCHNIISSSTSPMPPLRLHCSICARKLLQSYTQYWKGQAAFVKTCHKHWGQLGLDLRRNLCNNLQSMYYKIALLFNNALELLWLELLGEGISEASSVVLSDESSSDGISDVDSTSGNQGLIYMCLQSPKLKKGHAIACKHTSKLYSLVAPVRDAQRRMQKILEVKQKKNMGHIVR